jgi:hypothetical protein
MRSNFAAFLHGSGHGIYSRIPQKTKKPAASMPRASRANHQPIYSIDLIKLRFSPAGIA